MPEAARRSDDHLTFSGAEGCLEKYRRRRFCSSVYFGLLAAPLSLVSEKYKINGRKSLQKALFQKWARRYARTTLWRRKRRKWRYDIILLTLSTTSKDFLKLDKINDLLTKMLLRVFTTVPSLSSVRQAGVEKMVNMYILDTDEDNVIHNGFKYFTLSLNRPIMNKRKGAKSLYRDLLCSYWRMSRCWIHLNVMKLSFKLDQSTSYISLTHQNNITSDRFLLPWSINYSSVGYRFWVSWHVLLHGVCGFARCSGYTDISIPICNDQNTWRRSPTPITKRWQTAGRDLPGNTPGSRRSWITEAIHPSWYIDWWEVLHWPCALEVHMTKFDRRQILHWGSLQRQSRQVEQGNLIYLLYTIKGNSPKQLLLQCHTRTKVVQMDDGQLDVLWNRMTDRHEDSGKETLQS